MKTLEDVLSRFDPKVQFSGQIRMTCPFRENHEGRDAFAAGYGAKSFFATPDINSYHCFSCGAAGKLTHLLTTRFDVSYFDAVEYVNLIPVSKDRPGEFELKTMWDLTPPEKYLRRGFRESTLNDFKVGIEDKTGNIIVPLYEGYDLKGIKFRNERDFWYNDAFIKSEYLYNFNRKWKYTILVEGETDVWRLYQWKLNTTGLLGTSLSEFQANMLKEIPVIYLATDNDLPGLRAANNAYKMLHKHCDVRFINYPAEDPDLCRYRPFMKAFNDPANYAMFRYATRDLKLD